MKNNLLGILFLFSLLSLPFYSNASVTFIDRASVSNEGVEANDGSQLPSISGDGRYVAFSSLASNLVHGDTNNKRDVFVYDVKTKTIKRVSINNSGVQGNNESSNASISSDGRYIAFHSDATNLVPGDTNNAMDVFVYDTIAQSIVRVSVSSSGQQHNKTAYDPYISSDGQYVSFTTMATNFAPEDNNNTHDVYVHNLKTGITELISVNNSGVVGNLDSMYSSISSDGRYVSFGSSATNLVPGDTNGKRDIFVYDREVNVVSRVSISGSGSQGDGYSYHSVVSPDGRYVSFESRSTNLVPGDTNGKKDTFLYDGQNNSIKRISISDSGVQGNGDSEPYSMSDGGRFISYFSSASNLVSGDMNGTTDGFVYDQKLETVNRISVNIEGVEGNNFSFTAFLSSDGSSGAFQSLANNLVPNDTNSSSSGDIFYIRINTTTGDEIPPVVPEVITAFPTENNDSVDTNEEADVQENTLPTSVTPEKISVISVPADCNSSYKYSPSTGVLCPEISLPVVGPLSSTNVMPIGAKFVFSTNLYNGVTHSDVVELQKFLNNNGFPVVLQGVGSAGNETTTFGPRTTQALVKFQQSKGITPAVGYFGPITRAEINK